MKAEIAGILKTPRKDKFWAFILQTDFPLTLNLGLCFGRLPLYNRSNVHTAQQGDDLMGKDQTTGDPAAQEQTQHLFIVRIWNELQQPVAGQWRGSVEHVPSRQQLYFAALSDLNDFITLRLNGKPLTRNEK